jgi:hypothetical protein
MYQPLPEFIRDNWRTEVKKEWLIWAAIFAAGVILADRVRALPVVGSKIPRV